MARRRTLNPFTWVRVLPGAPNYGDEMSEINFEVPEEKKQLADGTFWFHPDLPFFYMLVEIEVDEANSEWVAVNFNGGYWKLPDVSPKFAVKGLEFYAHNVVMDIKSAD